MHYAREFPRFAIAEDFNAWAIDWGSKHTNSRGLTIPEAFSCVEITLTNNKQQTFSKNGNTTVMDLIGYERIGNVEFATNIHIVTPWLFYLE